MGYLHLDGWAGRQRVLVVIVGETRSKYRVRLTRNDARVVNLPGGRRRLIGLVPQLVPKHAVRLVGLGAVLSGTA